MRILVVDDDPTSAEMTTSILEYAGHTVVLAENGMEAVDNVGGAELIVSDMNMPLINGIELFRILHLQGVTVPYILLTGDDPEPLLEEEPQITACLLKDLSLETSLLKAIAGVTAKQDAGKDVPGKKKQGSFAMLEQASQLRRTYLERLPAILEETRGFCIAWLEGYPDDQMLSEARRKFHGIKGTAASFGLHDISQEGAVGEKLAVRLLASPGEWDDMPSLSLLDDFDACLTRIDALRAQAVEAENTAAEETHEQHEPHAAPEDVHHAQDERAGKAPIRKVFICEPEEGLRKEMKEQLACYGYAVSTFADLTAMGAAARQDAPDAIVMDTDFSGQWNNGKHIGLPNETSLPVVFISNKEDFDVRLKAIQAGGVAYFPKPVKVGDIVACLDTLTTDEEPEPFRVLIVDDEPEAAAYHSLILEEAGMVTRRLDRPERVLEELAEFKTDLVLMDMYMPGCSGYELATLIRQIPEFLSLPIVFLSTELDMRKQVSALRVGAEGFLTKPVDPEDLVNTIAIRAERMRTLRSLMVRDALTGLFNHTYMTQYLITSLVNAKRRQGKLCFVMIDVDYFKKVNDNYGHPAGDQVLIALARVLQQRLRNSDIVGRYGGEEFGAILLDFSVEEAVLVIDRLRQDFANITFRAGDQQFSCSFSAGVAGYPQHQSIQELLEASDQALYQAKSGGRNRIVPAPIPPTVDRGTVQKRRKDD